jgi:hypothetical protein
VCTDAHKATLWDELRQSDWKAFQGFVNPTVIREAALWAELKLTSGLLNPLNPLNLVWFAIGAAWFRSKCFADVLGLVLKLLQDGPDWMHSSFANHQRKGRKKAKRQKRHKHDPRGQDPTRLSEEAFVQARKKLPWKFWVGLLMVLTRDFEVAHADRVRWKRFRLLAIDGTTIRLDHWKKLADHFGTSSNGRGRRTTARMVMIQFPQTRIPWRYELTPCKEDERSIAGRMLNELRRDDLLLMDRGFWSFGLFYQIQNRGAFFATRQKAGVNLSKTIKRLGTGDRIVRHTPTDWRKQWKQQGLPESIDLRVIDYQIPGFRKTAVVTNILDPRDVSAQEWVRLATTDESGRVLEPGLYHRRWEIETTFRELKVVQGMEGGLRGRTPETIRYEIAGHVLLYMLTRWLMVEAAAKAGVDPLRLSFKSAREELSDMRETLLHADAERVRRVLLPRLLERIASHRVPPRPGRHYPRPRDTKPKSKGHGRYQKPSKLKRHRATNKTKRRT